MNQPKESPGNTQSNFQLISKLETIGYLLVLYTKFVVRTVIKTVVVQKITKKTLQRQFLGYRITRSLNNKLLESKTQEVNLCANNHRCESTSRCGQSSNQKLGCGCFKCL